MVAALSTELKTPTGTHLTAKEVDPQSIAQVVLKGLGMLYSAYKASGVSFGAGGPEILDTSAIAVSDLFKENRIDTKNKILEGFLAIKAGIPPVSHERHEDLKRNTHLCGWLMGYSGLLEEPDWWASAAGLELKYNPFPQVKADQVNFDGKGSWTVWDRPPEQASQSIAPSTPKEEESSLFVGEPKAFPRRMGDVEKQHFLVIEDLVNGGPAILSILAGCLWKSFARLERSQSELKPEVTIVDLTGEPYLGMEQDTQNPYFKVYYADVCDRPMSATLSEDESWHLPIMEGIWQASNALKERLRKKKLTSHTVSFPPHFLVLRRWNAILNGWSELSSEQKKALNAAWRETYDHPEDQSIDVRKAVKEILTLGDAVNVVALMSITCFGSVSDIGVRENELNSFLIVIPGAASISNGDKAIRSAMSDKRLQYVNTDNREKLREAIAQGQDFSRQTGCQYCLVNLGDAMIMTIPTLVGAGGDIPIEQAKDNTLLKKFKPSAYLNG